MYMCTLISRYMHTYIYTSRRDPRAGSLIDAVVEIPHVYIHIYIYIHICIYAGSLIDAVVEIPHVYIHIHIYIHICIYAGSLIDAVVGRLQRRSRDLTSPSAPHACGPAR